MATDPDQKRLPGTPPEGWVKVQFYVPAPVAERWNQIRGGPSGRSAKALGSLGLALITGAPEQARMNLLRWITVAELDGAESITPEAVWAEFERTNTPKPAGNIQMLGPVKPMTVVDVNGPTGNEITHEVTRILDPQILKGKKKGAA